MIQPSAGKRPGESTSTGAFPLRGLRVVDLSAGLAGSFCTLLLADLGADVVRIELPGDHRHRDEIDTIALQRNKSVAGIDPANPSDRRALGALIAEADVLVESVAEDSMRTSGLDLAATTAANPALIRCSLTSFGLSGPSMNRKANDLVVQALTGAMDITGEPDRPPVKMGIPLGEEISGLIAAIVILAKAEQREMSGRGCLIDAAAFDANVAMMSYMANIYFATGKSPKKLGSSHPTIFPYNAFKTKDSYIVAAPFTQIFWKKLCDVLGRSDLPLNPAYKSFAERLKNRNELAAIIDTAFLESTTAEWRERLDRGDVPNGPVNSVGDALAMEQTRFRGMVSQIATSDGQPVGALGTPFRFDFEGRASFKPSYARPKHVDDPARYWAPREVPVRGLKGESSKLPLAGLRVLDLTRMFAGPYCCLFLADLGAEVIKIEEPRIGDPTRRNIPMVNGESTYFMAVNRGKKSVTLDLKQPAARDALLRLVEKSDVVVENYRPGVMERLGLSYDELRKRKSDIILLSLSGFGQTGPMRDSISFDIVNQAMAGVMSVTGEENRPPVRIGVPVGDLAGGILGAYAVLAALRARRVTGLGSAMDLSLHDLMMTLLGPLAQMQLSTGVSPGTMGSSDRRIVPSRAFEAADGWLALTASSDAEWRTLAAILGRPAIADDPRYRTNTDRLGNREAADREVQDAVRRQTVTHWVDVLSANGIACAPIRSLGEGVDSEQARARGMILSYKHAIAGECRGVGTAMRVDGSLLTAELPPPALGEHSKEILRRLAGLSEAEWIELGFASKSEVVAGSA
ncbi:CoA transferase [Bradyrhizobium sp. LHD-71]|uniref:CaiB/BaiF CoA transferase family protein n=1 Tax=Bradyrhizobium sp. LHD-71 TaxID=3072141 RepID=UPI00281024B8|nr:CoA transferase [Bradyrhizobium sp. LHD-71]MDQ8726596.1 CoA transferase [Bradyrhizobium sp. LHD-71]